MKLMEKKIFYQWKKKDEIILTRDFWESSDNDIKIMIKFFFPKKKYSDGE